MTNRAVASCAQDVARHQDATPYRPHPLNRTGTAKDAAYAIHFLLSDAARFIDGQILAVDGGWTATRFLSESAIAAQAADEMPR